ncbi:MAG TPA: HAD-IB family phosphatase [Gaiellales bacterium]|nr:HAD-IB family phosphatase [Gaiellales bacterium]
MNDARPWLVVCDFDGTISERDTLDEICRRFAPPGVYEQAEAGLGARSMTLREVLRFEFEPIRGDHDQIVAETVRSTTVRAGFGAFVTAARSAGNRVVVISSGFRDVIEPVLRREGLGDLELVAHDVRFSPAGSRVIFRHGELCELCGEECKRSAVRALGHDGPVAYVGDGHSDRCAAEAADRRFAIGSLARHLSRRGLVYTPFRDFDDVRAGLLGT